MRERYQALVINSEPKKKKALAVKKRLNYTKTKKGLKPTYHNIRDQYDKWSLKFIFNFTLDYNFYNVSQLAFKILLCFNLCHSIS